MSKYNAKLDIDHENSLSIIINHIRPNSKVLEFGPAHGRLTKYLSETMNCEVTIVEIDEEAGQEAARFAKKSYLGNEQGDIEKYYWLNNNGETFDYIIFADVLEHLYCPDKVLKSCEDILKEDGRIFISIPNIAHNSIIINLLNDKFKYNSVGLLDNTHIKFFTYYSFIELVNSLDYEVGNIFATYSEVGENEIKAIYEDVSLSVQKALKKRPLGRVYQYVFEVGKRGAVERNYEIKEHQPYSLFEMNFYIKEETDEDYSEGKRITKYYNENKAKFNIDLSNYKGINSIRIDPIESNGIVKVNKIYSIANEINEVIDIVSSNARGVIDNNIYFFDTQDPQWIVELDRAAEKIVIEFEVIDYQMDAYETYDILIQAIKKGYEVGTEIENRRIETVNYCETLEETNKIASNCIAELEKQIIEHKSYENQLEKREQEYKKYQEILETRVSQHKEYEEQLENQITEHKTYEKQLENQVTEHKVYTEELAESINRHKEYKEQLEGGIEEHKIYISELETRIKEYSQYQEQLIQNVDEAKDKELVLQGQIKDNKQQIEQLRAELEEKNKFIDQVKKSKLFKLMKIK